MLKLYRFPGATCAAKVLMALHEKAVLFEDICLDRGDLGTEWYRKLNPNGVVPTIVHDGAVITESSVILNYVEDRFVGSGIILRPSAPLLCAAMNHWLKMLDDLLPSLGTMTYAIASRQRYLGLSQAEREGYYSSIPDPYVRASRRDAIELGLGAPDAARSLHKLLELTDHVEAATQDCLYLCGDFSLADISLAPFVSRMEALGLLRSLEKRPYFQKWWGRVRGRPSFILGVSQSTPPEVAKNLEVAAERHAADITRLLEGAP